MHAKEQKNVQGSATEFYITTAIPYVNSRPHVGFALEAVQADVIARYLKKNKDVFFLSGADEHGVKIIRSAESVKKDVREFVNENTFLFIRLLKDLNISNDNFIRTSDKERHFPGAGKLWKMIEKSGDLYKDSYKGLYCVGHEAFVTEKDLVNGKCADHGKEPEVVEEENYFFRLSKYAGRIKEAIGNDELKIYPDFRKNEIIEFINSGVEDVSFSRPSKDISWGIPVPGDDSQTMYVWCDALSNYLTGLGFGTKDESKFEKYWPCNMHVVGKDITRFHALIWPGMLLSAGLPLPESIFIHGFITSKDQKMSKTLGNVIDPFDYLSEYGADALRYYLIREIPAFNDGDFTEDKFLKAYNGNLANGLGNFVSRTAKMAEQYFGGKIEKPSDENLVSVPFKKHFDFPGWEGSKEKIKTMTPSAFLEVSVFPEYYSAMENYEIRDAIDIVFKFINNLDGYIQEYEPFKLVKTDPEKTRTVLWNLSFGATSIADMLRPFMPETADKISDIFTKDESMNFIVKTADPLFKRK